MSKISSAAFCFLMLACAAPLPAQEEEGGGQQDYQKMMQQMMKSANSQGQSETWDARLKVISGSVMVKPADSEEWSGITGEIPLDPDDAVKTASDGVAELYLDDKAAVAIGRNTQLDISSLEQGDTVFSLNFGSIVAKVKHLLNDKFKMQVRTPSAVCAVRGTEFAVEHSQLGKETTVAVFDEGRLAVTQAEGAEGAAQEYLLEKNNEITLAPDKKRLRTVPLARMSRHRGALGTMRARLTALKGWKPKSQARRSALRDQALKRKIIRRQLKSGAKAKVKAKGRSSAKTKAAAARRAKAKRQAQEEAGQEQEQEPGQE
ncbi:MAG: hypothetical protein A2X35_05990 [Elusimicrobia bacterium GWA2_61_42]|nr:MAG: hypothetical protein A2X35_05990 [Elusimicrobia bacterium GWA2_61_42]OGR80315.1 MAG: hypothetical protein A2X38_01015 [Elusimicrobia bacterium GWC2_61_25]